MSQRDLVAELQAARIAAPAEVRERVRAIAAHSTPPRRVFTWRRGLVVALPAAAAIVAAVVVTRPSPSHDTTVTFERAAVAHGSVAGTPKTFQTQLAAPRIAPGRVQRYNASISLRLRDVSSAVKSVQRITSSLGGYPVSIQVDAQGRRASADLVVKVPRVHVQEAIRRFSALGTITAEDVRVQDLEAGLNATDRTIARLQKQLAATIDPDQAAALKTRIERLQRGEAATRRTAHYATVSLHLETPSKAMPAKHGHGPWHGLAVGLRWLGIGAVYALVFGAPLVLLALAWRLVRRRREDALLSRS